MPIKPKKGSVTPVGPGILVYQMKVTLKGIRPPVWRRIQVTSDMTLKVFHKTIQIIMDWEDEHLHGFIIKGLSYGTAEDGFGVDEKKVRLNSLNLQEKDKFIYLYDFGDNWEHTILVEKILPMDEKTQYPICLMGKRSCPPEDSGGPWCYEELLDIIKNPHHPEYEDSVDCLGEDFDPEWFEVEIINMELEIGRR